MSVPITLLPFQPATMSTAQLAAVSYLARYSGRTHVLYSFQLRQWFTWCQSNALDPLVGIQRAHVELYIRQLGEHGLMDSSVATMMHAVRGYSGSPTSTASSAQTPPSTPGCPRSTATSHAPKVLTGSS
jgi:integrase/recombinase XerD